MPARGVKGAEAGAGGWSESAERLRAGDIHGRVRALQPSGLRKKIVKIHAHHQLVPLSKCDRLAERVLRPPNSARPRDADSRVPTGEGGRVGECPDVEERVLEILGPQIRTDRVIRNVNTLARDDVGLRFTGKILVGTSSHSESDRQAAAQALNGEESPAAEQIVQDAAAVHETPILADWEVIAGSGRELQPDVCGCNALG